MNFINKKEPKIITEELLINKKKEIQEQEKKIYNEKVKHSKMERMNKINYKINCLDNELLLEEKKLEECKNKIVSLGDKILELKEEREILNLNSTDELKGNEEYRELENFVYMNDTTNKGKELLNNFIKKIKK